MSAVVEFPEVRGRPFSAVGDEGGASASLELAPATVEPAGDLVAWTPERAAALVRGFGLVLHTFDPATELEGGADLWRATKAEAAEIGEPLSRILARYEPARRLAGVVDEAELGAAFVSYTKRNLRTRGRLVLAERERDSESVPGGED